MPPKKSKKQKKRLRERRKKEAIDSVEDEMWETDEDSTDEISFLTNEKSKEESRLKEQHKEEAIDSDDDEMWETDEDSADEISFLKYIKSTQKKLLKERSKKEAINLVEHEICETDEDSSEASDLVENEVVETDELIFLQKEVERLKKEQDELKKMVEKLSAKVKIKQPKDTKDCKLQNTKNDYQKMDIKQSENTTTPQNHVEEIIERKVSSINLNDTKPNSHMRTTSRMGNFSTKEVSENCSRSLLFSNRNVGSSKSNNLLNEPKEEKLCLVLKGLPNSYSSYEVLQHLKMHETFRTKFEKVIRLNTNHSIEMNKTLPHFIVQAAKGSSLWQIFKIKVLNNFIIQWEKPLKPFNIKCIKCQKWFEHNLGDCEIHYLCAKCRELVLRKFENNSNYGQMQICENDSYNTNNQLLRSTNYNIDSINSNNLCVNTLSNLNNALEIMLSKFSSFENKLDDQGQQLEFLSKHAKSRNNRFGFKY